jgi:hypothetical protein
MSDAVQLVPAAASSVVDSASATRGEAERLEKLEAEIRSLKGKGVAIAVIAALLGSGGATAIATTYLSGRTLVVQERLAKIQEEQASSEIAQKALQNQQIALQNQQIGVDTKLKQQTLASERVKADEASFEARLKAYASDVERLRQEQQKAAKAGDAGKAAEIALARNREIASFRTFIDLQRRYVEQNPDVPGWYRLGIAQADDECRRIPN